MRDRQIHSYNLINVLIEVYAMFHANTIKGEINSGSSSAYWLGVVQLIGGSRIEML